MKICVISLHLSAWMPYADILVTVADEQFVACALAHRSLHMRARKQARKGNHFARNIVTDLNLNLWKPQLAISQSYFSSSLQKVWCYVMLFTRLFIRDWISRPPLKTNYVTRYARNLLKIKFQPTQMAFDIDLYLHFCGPCVESEQKNNNNNNNNNEL